MLLPLLTTLAYAADVVQIFDSHGSDIVSSLAADGHGGFLVSGAFQGTLSIGEARFAQQTDTADYYDLFLARYSAAGALLGAEQRVGYISSVGWSAHGLEFAAMDVGEIFSGGDRIFSLSTTPTGRRADGGWRTLMTGQVGLVTHRSEAGTWSVTLPENMVMDVVCLEDGVVAAGRGGVTRLEDDGTTRWHTVLPAMPDAVAVAADGTIGVAGIGRIWVLSADGEVHWTLAVDEAMHLTGAAFDADGRLVVAGWHAEAIFGQVYWLSPDGELLATERLSATGGFTVSDLIVTADRTLVGGYFSGELEGGPVSRQRAGVVLSVRSDVLP